MKFHANQPYPRVKTYTRQRQVLYFKHILEPPAQPFKCQDPPSPDAEVP